MEEKHRREVLDEEILAIDTMLAEEDPLLADCLRQASESLAWRRFLLEKERKEKEEHQKNEEAFGDSR